MIRCLSDTRFFCPILCRVLAFCYCTFAIGQTHDPKSLKGIIALAPGVATVGCEDIYAEALAKQDVQTKLLLGKITQKEHAGNVLGIVYICVSNQSLGVGLSAILVELSVARTVFVLGSDLDKDFPTSLSPKDFQGVAMAFIWRDFNVLLCGRSACRDLLREELLRLTDEFVKDYNAANSR
jgi:hypothetical protein